MAKKPQDISNEWVNNPMEITVKNFGPIKKAQINLRNLTLIIGPNNSGKSYLTTAIYTTLRAVRPAFRFRREIPYRSLLYDRTGESEELVLSEKIRDDISGRIIDAFKSKNQFNITIPQSIVIKLLQNYETIVSSNLKKELIKAFAVPLSHLRRLRKYKTSIILESLNKILSFQIQSKKIDAKMEFENNATPSINLNYDAKTISAEIDIAGDKSNAIALNVYRATRSDRDEIISRVLFALELSIEQLMDPYYKRMNYLPAARAGVAQTYKTLMAGSTLLYPIFGIDEGGIQRFSGAIADLAGTIMELDRGVQSFFIEDEEESGEFEALSTEFENRMVNGEIELKKSSHGGAPDIIFKQHEIEYPIHASASSIAELAPIFLYLKRLIRRESLLIIEEPEAHLHPKNQLEMAKLIARLVNLNVNTMITTHSDYLVESLSHLIRASMSPKLPKGLKKKEILHSNEVGVYLLIPQADGSTISKEQKVGELSGIRQDEFNEVIDLLYGMARNVDRGLMDLGNAEKKEP